MWLMEWVVEATRYGVILLAEARGLGPTIQPCMSDNEPDMVHVKLMCQVFNIAAARAVDQEFKYNFGSTLGLLGSGRGLNGRGAPVGSIWTELQLKRSHGDPFRDQNNVFVRLVFPWY